MNQLEKDIKLLKEKYGEYKTPLAEAIMRVIQRVESLTKNPFCRKYLKK
jgi:hypothetical protein